MSRPTFGPPRSWSDIPAGTSRWSVTTSSSWGSTCAVWIFAEFVEHVLSESILHLLLNFFFIDLLRHLGKPCHIQNRIRPAYSSKFILRQISINRCLLWSRWSIISRSCHLYIWCFSIRCMFDFRMTCFKLLFYPVIVTVDVLELPSFCKFVSHYHCFRLLEQLVILPELAVYSICERFPSISIEIERFNNSLALHPSIGWFLISLELSPLIRCLSR